MPYVPRVTFIAATRKEVANLKRKRWEDPIGLALGHGGSWKFIDLDSGKTIEAKSGDLRYDYVPAIELEWAV